MRVFLNLVAVIAFGAGVVATLMGLSYVDDDPGMGPLAAALVILFYAVPAFLLALLAFVFGRVLAARKRAVDGAGDEGFGPSRQDTQHAAPFDGPIVSAQPKPARFRIGQVLVIVGALYGLWCVARHTILQLRTFELLHAGGTQIELPFLLGAGIGVLATAVPGLLMCWLGYWLKRPAKPTSAPWRTA